MAATKQEGILSHPKRQPHEPQGRSDVDAHGALGASSSASSEMRNLLEQTVARTSGGNATPACFLCLAEGRKICWTTSTLPCVVLYRALRQWRRGNIALGATQPVKDSLNLVQRLQPRCLEDALFFVSAHRVKSTAHVLFVPPPFAASRSLEI